MEKISIRKAKEAKSGLRKFIKDCKKIAKVDLKTIVEIGSYVGDSTEIFAENFETVFAIDPWENSYDDTDASSYRYPMYMIEKQFDDLCKKNLNIMKIKSFSLEKVKYFEDESIDMVYIDGIHQYEAVKEDILAWAPKVKIGGIIAGHDYQTAFQGCIDAVEEALGTPKIKGKDTSWGFIKRRSSI